MDLDTALFQLAATDATQRSSALQNLRAFLASGGNPDRHVVEIARFGNVRMRGPLLWAAATAALLAADANVHADHDVALRAAARAGHVARVSELLAAAADVHSSDDMALRTAAIYGHFAIVEHLLAAGADVHADREGALRAALAYGRHAVAIVLGRGGADACAAWSYVHKTHRQRVKAALNALAAAIPASQRRSLIETAPRQFPALVALEEATRRRIRDRADAGGPGSSPSR